MLGRVVAGITAIGLAAWVAPASAQSKEDFKELQELPIPAPEHASIAKAKPMAPSWCGAIKAPEGYSGGALKRSIEAGIKTDWSGLVNAAQITCKWPNEPAVHHAVAVITGHWMNYSGLSQAKAMEVLGLHAQDERFKADKKKLCDQLKISDEVEGEDKEFMAARRHLFACTDDAPMWLSDRTFTNFDNPLLPFLDAGVETPDEIVRIAYVLSRTAYVFKEADSYRDKYLLAYVIDQFDLANLSEPAANALLDAGIYKGNSYARAVVVASAGRAKLAAAKVKDEVDKRAKDADWKELLVTAPKRGWDGYVKDAATHKDALARSAAFEKTFWGPSKKAMKGCWAPLRKDFIAVLKTLKHSTDVETYESLNQPIPSLLFERLAACAAVDQDKLYANRLLSMTRDLRYSRGPRIAAHYAALEALGQILADRSKFPIKLDDLKLFEKRALYDRAFEMEKPESKMDTMPWVGDAGEGTVKSTKPGKDGGVVVTFVNTKTQVMSQSCTETNRIVTWDHDGRPIYYRKCKDTGLVWINTTPEPITVPKEWSEGIKAGAVVKFDATPAYNKGFRYGLPLVVYADKKKKGVVNYLGFGPL